MGSATPQPTLNHLRQVLAGIDPAHAPRLTAEECLVGLAPPIDAALGGGLVCGALHELAPTAPVHLGAASGFAAAIAARASLGRREILWIATDYAVAEGGGPYGPGLDLFGLASSHLLVLRVTKPVDVLWAMEEALRCRALACVIAELTGEGEMADLTATRRLTLAAREGVSARIRPRPPDSPQDHRHAERGGDPLGNRRGSERARRARPPHRRARPRALRPFSPQEPARTRRPLDHRVGPS